MNILIVDDHPLTCQGLAALLSATALSALQAENEELRVEVEYEKEHGVRNVDDAALSGYRGGGLRAYRLDNAGTAGQSIGDFRHKYPQYRLMVLGNFLFY